MALIRSVQPLARQWCHVLSNLTIGPRQGSRVSGYPMAEETTPDLTAINSGLSAGGDVRMQGMNVAGRDIVIGEQHLHSSRATPTSLFQLPYDISDFTGRYAVLAAMNRFLESPRGSGNAVPILTIFGRAGVGKTALAVHFAHQVRSLFPDGQLFVELLGSEGRPRDPATVLAQVLAALGVDVTVIPVDLYECARLYRSQLQQRRVLVVLDSASNEAQVRPLLPGSPGCAVLVTSRVGLPSLAGSSSVPLEPLTAEESLELLGKVAGRQRIAADLESAEAIAALCGYLPLALRIAGARLAARPHLRLPTLVKRLSDERQVLDELRMRDLDARTTFTLGYADCAAGERRAFRLLGLISAEDFSARTAAIVLDTGLPEAEDLLEGLVEAKLLEVAGEDPSSEIHYRFHDLMRVFARERLHEEEPIAGQRAAARRMRTANLATSEAEVC